MDNKIISLIIAVAVGSILIGNFLVPIITDTSDDQHEYYNNAVGQYSKIVSDEVTLEYIANVSEFTYTYSVDGEPQTTQPSYNDVLFATSGAMFKVAKATGSLSSYLIWYTEESGSRRIDSPTNVTATLTPTSISFEVTPTSGSVESFTIPIEWGFYAVTTGDYRAVWDPYDVKINNINQVYSVNWLSTTNKFFSANGENVFYDGQTIEADYDLTPISGVVNVFNLKSGDFTITVDNNGEPYTATPFNVIVPVEIIGDKSGASDSITDLLFVIPIILIVVLAAVAIKRIF